MEISFTPAPHTAIELDDPLGIPGNLVIRAVQLALDAMRVTGRIGVRLEKCIPMGAGLGGGSSDAASVLLALPALAGRVLGLAALYDIAQQLGSDVPFFLLGGTAAGIGRGSEVFPLPDAPPRRGLLVAPPVHVSTPQAYSDLSPRLTTEFAQNKIFSFQSLASGGGVSAANDFEAVVFERHPRLALLKKRLVRAGAGDALMTGSGSALFGLFADRDGVSRALDQLRDEQVFRFSLVSRARYRRMWWQALESHMQPNSWPPESRYAR
jgi:4-diphosphocytidyl-2-C-methyl-D-erythritol kinase